jgi:hypothetical protein
MKGFKFSEGEGYLGEDRTKLGFPGPGQYPTGKAILNTTFFEKSP